MITWNFNLKWKIEDGMNTKKSNLSTWNGSLQNENCNIQTWMPIVLNSTKVNRNECLDILLTLMMTATFATPLSMLYHIPVDITKQITCWILEIKINRRNYFTRTFTAAFFTRSDCVMILSWIICPLLCAEYPPMSLALAATGLRNSVTNFLASRRISMMLLSRAKRGARGKDATNRVTKPNWITGCWTKYVIVQCTLLSCKHLYIIHTYSSDSLFGQVFIHMGE